MTRTLRKFGASIQFVVALVAGLMMVPSGAGAVTSMEVVKTYADIAEAGYEDSLLAARNLQVAVNTFLAAPSDDTLQKARQAWLASRVPYQQTEVYRFGNAIVDEWEGKVNAWPLDEGLIDYVADAYGAQSGENALYSANVIATPVLKISGKTVDASTIDKTLIAETLHEAGGIESNVASGYHAIEFLLWGQDNNGTGPGAGNRPVSDYNLGNCTGGNCDRRAAYLRAVTDLLVDDLTWMAAQWRDGGAARTKLAEEPGGRGLLAIFTGIGSLSYGELAGERIKLGLLLHDPEEEHDCFSDNTHNSHYYDALGIRNVYFGRYVRTDGSIIEGPSVSDLVAKKSKKIDDRVRRALDATMARMTALVKRAETVEAYDQMIGEGNRDGNELVSSVIEHLVRQTKEVERAIAVLEIRPIAFEGSDSLDSPGSVQ